MPVSISLVMIVKDEAAVLARSLGSAQGLVDEMVVVDTGSSDESMGIAESFGARLFSCEWTDDFSEARNHGLEQATGSWILALDADEEIVADAARLRAILAGTSKDGLTMRCVVAADIRSVKEGRIHYSDNVTRLFRNDPSLRYVDPIHEYVPVTDPDSLDADDFMILHFGPVVEATKDRRSRNLPILRNAVKQNPSSGRLHYYLANDLLAAGDYEGAGESYDRALDEGGLPPEYVAGVLRDMSLCLARVGRPDLAFQSLAAASIDFPSFTDLGFVEGLIALEAGDLFRARSAFARCLDQGEPDPGFPSWGGTGSWRPQAGLDEAARQLAKMETQ